MNPGPGSYNINSGVGRKVRSIRFVLNDRKEKKIETAADMCTYTPCPV